MRVGLAARHLLNQSTGQGRQILIVLSCSCSHILVRCSIATAMSRFLFYGRYHCANNNCSGRGPFPLLPQTGPTGPDTNRARIRKITPPSRGGLMQSQEKQNERRA